MDRKRIDKLEKLARENFLETVKLRKNHLKAK